MKSKKTSYKRARIKAGGKFVDVVVKLEKAKHVSTISMTPMKSTTRTQGPRYKKVSLSELGIKSHNIECMAYEYEYCHIHCYTYRKGGNCKFC